MRRNWSSPRTATPKSIAVVGAGPAGMAAAITAAQRGHKVTLYDAATRPGGQLHLAATIPGKEEFRGLIDWFTHQLDHPNITLRLGTDRHRSADLTRAG